MRFIRRATGRERPDTRGCCTQPAPPPHPLHTHPTPTPVHAQKSNYHLAVGSLGSYTLGGWHKVAVLDATTLQPLKILKEPTGQVGAVDHKTRSCFRSGF